jgi:hypothetical protein
VLLLRVEGCYGGLLWVEEEEEYEIIKLAG